MSNLPTKTGQQVSLKSLLEHPSIKGRFAEILKDKRDIFISSLLSIVNQDAKLLSCEPMTIISAALQAAILDLPLEPTFGYVHIVPYNVKQKDENGREYWVKKAQFQMGWRGFVQLGQRTGMYLTINTSEVREGDIMSYNPLTGDYEFNTITDFIARKTNPIIGYIAYFKLANGFEKSLFMTVDELKDHAKQYSKTFQGGFGKWVDDFHSMAKKTPLKLLLQRFGPMSTSLKNAIASDQAILDEDLTPQYIDNPKEETSQEEINREKETARFLEQLNNVETLEDLEMFEDSIPVEEMPDEWKSEIEKLRAELKASADNKAAAANESEELLKKAAKIKSGK